MKKILSIFLTAIFLFPALCYGKIQKTTWRPDTCDNCVVIYEWDDTVPQEERVHTPVEISGETETGTKEEKYQKILEKNQRKNLAVAEVLKNSPEISDGNGGIKEGVNISFFYDESDVLHLSISGVSDKVSNQDKINKKVGDGKVILE